MIMNACDFHSNPSVNGFILAVVAAVAQSVARLRSNCYRWVVPTDNADASFFPFLLLLNKKTS